LSSGNFECDSTVDSNGVLILRFAGLFNTDDWLTHVQEKQQSDQKTFNPDQPVIVDLQDFKPPESDWSDEIRKVLSWLKVRGPRRGRRALIIGENMEAQIAGHFYVKFKEAIIGIDEGLRIFVSHDEGYAWVSEGWLNPQPQE
jgi:hypothetical protein